MPQMQCDHRKLTRQQYPDNRTHYRQKNMTTDQEIEATSEAKFWAKTLSAILASVDSILGRLGTLFPWLRDRLDRPVIVRSQRRNWWHMGRTGDGKPSMQIVTYWYVTNRTDLWVPNIHVA